MSTPTGARPGSDRQGTEMDEFLQIVAKSFTIEEWHVFQAEFRIGCWRRIFYRDGSMDFRACWPFDFVEESDLDIAYQWANWH